MSASALRDLVALPAGVRAELAQRALALPRVRRRAQARDLLVLALEPRPAYRE